MEKEKIVGKLKEIGMGTWTNFGMQNAE
jgi:hypothetical protein